MANKNDFSKKVPGGNPLPVKSGKPNKMSTGSNKSKGIAKKASSKPMAKSLKGTKGMKGKRSPKPKSLQPIEDRRRMD